MTKYSEKVEKLWADQQKKIKIIGKQVTREHRVNLKRLGSEEFEDSRFVFTLEDLDEKSTKNSYLYAESLAIKLGITRNRETLSHFGVGCLSGSRL